MGPGQAANGQILGHSSESKLSASDWKGIDGATAWHLIDRQAEDWAEVGAMMTDWLEANQPSLSRSDSSKMLQFVLANGLPIRHEGKFRYHGVSELLWHDTKEEAILAAMRDISAASS
jgi:hypothetical protein